MLSKFIRRTHLYLGLLLTQWILLYALSTLACSPRGFSPDFSKPTAWVKESEQVLPVQFSAGARPEFMGKQILQILHLDGNVRAFLSEGENTLTVLRNEAVSAAHHVLSHR
jgi:hypothetical protein